MWQRNTTSLRPSRLSKKISQNSSCYSPPHFKFSSQLVNGKGQEITVIIWLDFISSSKKLLSLSHSLSSPHVLNLKSDLNQFYSFGLHVEFLLQNHTLLGNLNILFLCLNHWLKLPSQADCCRDGSYWALGQLAQAPLFEIKSHLEQSQFHPALTIFGKNGKSTETN